MDCGESSTGPRCVPLLSMTTQISSAFTVICLTGLLRRVAEPGMFRLPGPYSDIYGNISGPMIDTTMKIRGGRQPLEMPTITCTAQMSMIRSQ